MRKWLSGLFCCISLLCLLAVDQKVQAQRVGYVSTDLIRERFPEAQQVEQRIKEIAKEWEQQLEKQRKEVEQLEQEIRENRLIWSEQERKQKEAELLKKKRQLEEETHRKYAPGGEFDQLVLKLLRPVEEKIAAAIKETAEAKGYDIIWDKSKMPLIYTNPRYDITLDVMERLGINVADLRAEYEKLLEKLPGSEESRRPSIRPRRPPTKEERLREQHEQREIERPEQQKEVEQTEPPKK